MGDEALPNMLSRLDAVRDILSVRRVFGEAYEVDGATVIPVATVRGGGGGGGGGGDAVEGPQTAGGGGLGFGVIARPVGVFVVKDGTVTWSPSIDVLQIVVGAQLVALAAVLTFGRVSRRRHASRRRRVR